MCDPRTRHIGQETPPIRGQPCSQSDAASPGPACPEAGCARPESRRVHARHVRPVRQRARVHARSGHLRNGRGPRHATVHQLLEQGVGLLECARRLGWSLNTVKRYARAARAEELIRQPSYGTTPVDPYRDHLHRRSFTDPEVPATRLRAEIPELGYAGSANLLVRYSIKAAPTPDVTCPPRRLVSWIMTPARRPARARPRAPRRPAGLVPAAHCVGRPRARLRGSAHRAAQHRVARLDERGRGHDLPPLHAFVRGLRKGFPAVLAGLGPALQQRPDPG